MKMENVPVKKNIPEKNAVNVSKRIILWQDLMVITVKNAIVTHLDLPVCNVVVLVTVPVNTLTQDLCAMSVNLGLTCQKAFATHAHVMNWVLSYWMMALRTWLVTARDNVIAYVISKDLIAMNVTLNFMISPIVMNVVVTIMEPITTSVMIMGFVLVNTGLAVTNVMNALMDYMVFPIAQIALAIHKVHIVPFVILLENVLADPMLLEMNVIHARMVISIFPIA
jgi:hypothetical protein